MAHDVFICYSSRDKAVADAVCATLEGRKIRCWIAPRDVLPGVPYAEALIDAITQSQILVLVFSANANNSPQVMHEVERAVSKGIPILPLRIENVLPSKSMEYFISTTHWLDALTPPLEMHLRRLADTIEKLLASEAAVEPLPSGEKAASEAESPRKAEPPQTQAETVAEQPEDRQEPLTPSRSLSFLWIGLGSLCVLAGLFSVGIALLVGLLQEVKTPAAVGMAGATVARISPTQAGLAKLPTSTRFTVTLNPTLSPIVNQASATPLIPSIQIVRTFNAPAFARAIGWDGANLWIAQGDFAEMVTLLKMDSSGNTSEVYIINDHNILMPPYGFGDDVGMVWVENTLWLGLSGPVHGYRIESGNITAVGSIPGIDNSMGGSEGFPITWDGEGYWLAHSDALYRKSSDGGLLKNFMYSYGIRALGWDGDYLWASTGMFARNGGRTLDVVNVQGGSIPIASFPFPAGMGEFIEGLAWDGQTLWALSNDKVFQLDIREARAYAAEQYRLRALTATLAEVLTPDPEVGENRVQVIKNTPSTLKITFAKYKYIVEVSPNTSQIITPPESVFVAEVPDVTPIHGSYLSLSGCTWTFSVTGPTTA